MSNIPRPTARRIAAMKNESFYSEKPTLKRRLPEGYDGMTHDELLARIDEEFGIIKFDENGKGLCNTLEAKGYYALRAVVEWHKCEEVTLPDGDWGIVCSYCSNNGFYSLYPCHTIQIIAKELK